MTDLEKDKILLLAHSIGKMARELQSIKRLLKEIADDSQTERIKTHDYCDICNHKGCKDCVANNLDDYCVPSHYAPSDDTPQTDCDTCRHYKLACELFSEVCKYEPITQTETQNSNLTFEKDECAKEYEELGLKELKELIKADRKTENSSEIPNNCEDEPQTCSVNGRPYSECSFCEHFRCMADEPQTDVYDYKGNGKWERSE